MEFNASSQTKGTILSVIGNKSNDLIPHLLGRRNSMDRGGLPVNPTQSNRRSSITSRKWKLEPKLDSFYSDTNNSNNGGVKTIRSQTIATRPPVVGRETGFNSSNSRFLSEDDHLKEYIETLQKKTSKLKPSGSKTGVSSTSLSDSDSDSELIEKPKHLQFLKRPLKTKGREIENNDLAAQKALSESHRATCSESRIFGALLKASELESKYKCSPPTRQEIQFSEINQGADDSAHRFQTKPAAAMEKTSFVRPESLIESDKYEPLPSPDSSLVSAMNVNNLLQLRSELSESSDGVEEQDRKEDPASSKSEIQSDSQDDSVLKVRWQSVNDLAEINDHANEISEQNNEKGAEDTDSSASNDTSSYSDDFEEESTVKSSYRPLPSRTELQKNETKIRFAESPVSNIIQHDMATQTQGEEPGSTLFLWNHLPQYPPAKMASFADPTRVSKVVVNQETLDALSSYKPSVLALDELIKMQLRGTRSFIELQRKNYVSAISNLKPNYRYTTWKDAQKVIKAKNKSGPLREKS